MGDGVERALARAAELETRVKSEVTTLERSYSDSERRIRSLIAEMADQREAIVAGGSRVRDAIADAHASVVQDLDSAGFRLSERLTEAGQRLTGSLGASSEEISVAMDRTGSAAVERIITEGTQFADFDRRSRRQPRRAPRRDQPKNGRRHPGSGRRDR